MQTRYRYKGRFISASKAQKIANLLGAKRHIKTEYKASPKAASEYRAGFRLAMDKLVLRAIEKDRKAAAQERKLKAKSAGIERRKREVKEEESIIRSQAYNVWKDIHIEGKTEKNAIKRSGFKAEDFKHFTKQDLLAYIRESEYSDEDFFDFEMSDLEEETSYGETE